MNQNIRFAERKKPLLLALLAFSFVLLLTGILVYFHYESIKKQEQLNLNHELKNTEIKLRQVLQQDMAAAGAMATLINEYGVPTNFDMVAKDLLNKSSCTKLISYINETTVTKVYPLNEKTQLLLGVDMTRDSLVRKEIHKYRSLKTPFFIGPRKLIVMGGAGIWGAIPLMKNGETYGYIGVMSKLDDIREQIGLSDVESSSYTYFLTKKDYDGKMAEFPFTALNKHKNSLIATANIQEGNWILSVGFSEKYIPDTKYIYTSILGFLIAFITAIWVYKINLSPLVLKKEIALGLQASKERADALEKSEQRFKNILENAAVGMALADKNGHWLRVNLGLCKMLGLEENDIVSKNIRGLIAQEDFNKYQQLWEQHYPNANTFSFQTKITSNNNDWIWTEWQVAPTYFDTDEVALVTIINITDEKEMINDLVQRNHDLEQFSYIVSHNLRGPLSSIIGLTKMMNEEQFEENKNTIINGLIKNALKMDEVISDLNAILSIKSGIDTIKEHIQLDQLIKDISTEIEPSVLQHQVQFKMNFEEINELESVKPYLHSIFLNLITNSIKYKQENKSPEIFIKTEKRAGHVVIHYADNGQGIDMGKYGDKVFGMYKRFHLKQEGKGLGLFMVKSQVNALQGKIEINSIPGYGTQFFISIPQENMQVA